MILESQRKPLSVFCMHPVVDDVVAHGPAYPVPRFYVLLVATFHNRFSVASFVYSDVLIVDDLFFAAQCFRFHFVNVLFLHSVMKAQGSDTQVIPKNTHQVFWGKTH